MWCTVLYILISFDCLILRSFPLQGVVEYCLWDDEETNSVQSVLRMACLLQTFENGPNSFVWIGECKNNGRRGSIRRLDKRSLGVVETRWWLYLFRRRNFQEDILWSHSSQHSKRGGFQPIVKKLVFYFLIWTEIKNLSEGSLKGKSKFQFFIVTFKWVNISVPIFIHTLGNNSKRHYTPTVITKILDPCFFKSGSPFTRRENMDERKSSWNSWYRI